MELTLERRDQQDGTAHIGGLMLTPGINEDYWAYRVRLTDKQSVVNFPKFSTIGIDFAVEEDWNTNFPFTCTAEEICDHIWHNAGDKSITREQVLAAIRLIQEAAQADRAKEPSAP